jgi:hypothetical protein
LLGFCIYFGYGMRNSRLGQELKEQVKQDESFARPGTGTAAN